MALPARFVAFDRQELAASGLPGIFAMMDAGTQSLRVGGMTALTRWQTFYEIVGTSAGALIGLQFVVLSLIASRPIGQLDPRAGQAFGTPTIVHFAAVFGLSALVCAPWDEVGTAALLWGVLGLGGVVYSLIVAWRMRTQTQYRPQFEDWLFHVLVPFVAYLTLAVMAYAAQDHIREALFGAGAAALLLLFSGIHNAWDTVTYHVFVKSNQRQG